MAVLRALLISVLIVLVSFLGVAYWSGTPFFRTPHMPPSAAVGTTGVLDDAEIS